VLNVKGRLGKIRVHKLIRITAWFICLYIIYIYIKEHVFNTEEDLSENQSILSYKVNIK